MMKKAKNGNDDDMMTHPSYIFSRWYAEPSYITHVGCE